MAAIKGVMVKPDNAAQKPAEGNVQVTGFTYPCDHVAQPAGDDEPDDQDNDGVAHLKAIFDGKFDYKIHISFYGCELFIHRKPPHVNQLNICRSILTILFF
jgi:hypothetical protein